jgi:CheY-like chemotaxis protein
MRKSDIALRRPLTSSALFNAVNAAVSKRPASLAHVLQSTKFDDLDAQWLAGVRVLVVDDSNVNLEVAQRILEKQGAIVTTCSDGLKAVEGVRADQSLDNVLMDVQMPSLDGNEATRRIRKELSLQRLPIVALTAGALVGERQRALEAGMNDFISKPFDPPALIRKLRRLVEEARGEPIPVVILDSNSVCQIATCSSVTGLCGPGAAHLSFAGRSNTSQRPQGPDAQVKRQRWCNRRNQRHAARRRGRRSTGAVSAGRYRGRDTKAFGFGAHYIARGGAALQRDAPGADCE